MAKNRTMTVSKNVFVGVAMQIVALLCSFAVRTAFIYILSKEYLGVNSLFTSVLSYLSLAELGVGTGISVFLYKPLVDNDHERIKTLMAFYKKCYMLIGVVILIIGLALIPFLDYLVNGELPSDLNLTIVYCMFLVNSVSSYFFSYRTALLDADQKSYITNLISQIFTIIKDAVLLLVLLFVKDYYVYLVGQIVSTLVMYVYIYIKTNKMYPYLKEKNVTPITKEERHAIYVNISSLMIYKIAAVVLSASDNIIISSMIDIGAVAILSNYNLITNAVKTILTKVSSAFTPTAANFKESGASPDEQEEVFRSSYMVMFIIYSFCAVCLAVFFNRVIDIWIGEDYLFSQAAVLAIVFYFYLDGVGAITGNYRTIYKLFNENRVSPVIAAILNIVLSIVLGHFWGVLGVLVATPIARLATYSWVDPYLLYKKAFKKSPAKFYLKYFIGIIYLVIMYLVVNFVVNLIPYTGIVMLAVQMLICILLTAVLVFIYVRFQKEYHYLKAKALFILRNLFTRHKPQDK